MQIHLNYTVLFYVADHDSCFPGNKLSVLIYSLWVSGLEGGGAKGSCTCAAASLDTDPAVARVQWRWVKACAESDSLLELGELCASGSITMPISLIGIVPLIVLSLSLCL